MTDASGTSFCNRPHCSSLPLAVRYGRSPIVTYLVVFCDSHSVCNLPNLRRSSLLLPRLPVSLRLMADANPKPIAASETKTLYGARAPVAPYSYSSAAAAATPSTSTTSPTPAVTSLPSSSQPVPIPTSTPTYCQHNQYPSHCFQCNMIAAHGEYWNYLPPATCSKHHGASMPCHWCEQNYAGARSKTSGSFKDWDSPR